ncbi:hypothetical protein EB796_007686 [Bugula neritina]|uniref:Uncharacterized protein n=1 Tax=Bugula neritina TaxID=10212 RepID=A0A7J7K737_BUGNE|nr:hypothetical protein EB796_007686 [Bugula neritina]
MLTEINTLSTVLSEISNKKQEAQQLSSPTIAWDQEHKVFTGVPTGSRVSLTDFSPDELNSVCSRILSIEDAILQALPNVETLTLLEQSGTKLRSSELTEQRKAIEDLVAGFVIAILEKAKLTLAELVELLKRNGWSELNTKHLEDICKTESNIKTATDLCFGEQQKQELMTSYKMCVEILIKELKCLTLADQIKVIIFLDKIKKYNLEELDLIKLAL